MCNRYTSRGLPTEVLKLTENPWECWTATVITPETLKKCLQILRENSSTEQEYTRLVFFLYEHLTEVIPKKLPKSGEVILTTGEVLSAPQAILSWEVDHE